MSEFVSASLRRLVAERANNRCEYCLLPEAISLHRHEPDHIIPIQHDGTTSADNLALACFYCNRYKGPNVGSFDLETGLLTALFHPRLQVWREHFRIDVAEILPLTPIGRVTVRLLHINDPVRILERRRLIDSGLFR